MDAALARWRERLALAAYGALLGLLLPLVFARYAWRARREPGYRAAWAERLGRLAPVAPGAVWVHAVSLGETRAAAALVAALRERLPGMRLLLTHGTATGRAAGRDLLREGDVQAWLPLDTPGAVRRFFARARPRVGVLMETEVWPSLLAASRRAAVPMVLANARLSDKSARRGARFAFLLRPAAAVFEAVLAQSPEDAQRLREAGARAGAVAVCGNLKFDIAPDAGLVARGRAWRAALGRPVLLFAITREGEEQMLLDRWKAARADAPAPLLLVVPRHPQRFDDVAALLAAQGLSTARRSRWGDEPDPAALAADAWLGDSLGEMPAYYGCADVALLGGSFAPLGGHNLIEAAACGCPLVVGPSTFNFAQAARQAVDAGAAWQAADMADALRQAMAVIGTPAREDAARRGLAFAAAHRGAAARTAARIAALTGEPARGDPTM